MRLLASVIVGIAAGLFLIGIFSAYFGASSLQSDEEHTSCQVSLQDVKSKASFVVLTPTKLPEGYSLQMADIGPENIVYLYYFTNSLCDKVNPVRPEDGIIEIVEGPLNSVSTATNGADYVEELKVDYQTGGVNADIFVLENGMHAIGYESGISTSLTTAQNNTIVNTSDHLRPAALWVVDDGTGTLCKIEARSALHSLSDLLDIAESLV